MPSDELGPDSDTLKPTLRSAAIAAAATAMLPAANAALRIKVLISASPVDCLRSWEQLDRRQCSTGIQQVDALERDQPDIAAPHQAVPRDTGEHQLLLAARFDVDEGRVQLTLPCNEIGLHDARLLQHVLAAARRVLRMRFRALQALDTQLEQQLVFVCKRVVLRVFCLRIALQRNPVAAFVGEQREPFVEAARVDQRGFVLDEIDQIAFGGGVDHVADPLRRPSEAKPRPGMRRRSCTAVCPAGRLPCAPRSHGPRRNSLRSLRSLRSNNRRESDVDARAARARPRALRSSAPHNVAADAHPTPALPAPPRSLPWNTTNASRARE